MANSFGITEVTLAQLGDSTHAINAVGTSAVRKSVYQPIVARATDHDDDTGVNADTEAKVEAGCALFLSRRHGEPWEKLGALVQKVEQAAADTGATPPSTDVSVLFPNFDYTTFE